jgi:hypothetical protein
MRIHLCLMICFLAYKTNAQQISPNIINNSGQHFSNGNAQLTFSIGEPSITRVSNGTNTITQGFLQGKKIGSSIDKKYLDKIEWDVYPNPSNGKITIASDFKQSFDVLLIDAFGRILIETEYQNNEIDLGKLASGTYQLILSDKDKNHLGIKPIIKI